MSGGGMGFFGGGGSQQSGGGPQESGGGGKNVLIAVVLCLVVLLGWQFLSPLIFPTPPKPATSAATAATGGAGSLAGGTGTAIAAGAGAATATTTATAVAGTATATGTSTAPAPGISPLLPTAAVRPPESNAVIENDLMRVTFSTRGATIVSWELKNPAWLQDEPSGRKAFFNVVTDSPTAPSLPAQLQLTGAPFAYPAGTADDYTVVSNDDASVVMKWTDPSGGGSVERRFSLVEDKPYFVRSEVTLNSASSVPAEVSVGIVMVGFQDPGATQERGIFSGIVDATSGICHIKDDVERKTLDDALEDGGVSIPGVARWFGIDRQYFLLSVVPDPNPATGNCEFGADLTGVIRAALRWKSETLPARGSHTWGMDLYGGPKVGEPLERANAEMDLAIDYGYLAILCKPLIWLMTVFFDWFGNWGLAILMVTLVVRGGTFYWNQKAYRSMQDMARLKPEMDRVKKKFESDKQRLNQELSALMRNNNVNPLGGCLPMLLPMPIFFALYYTIWYSAELYRAPFFGWITDLSATDPYYVFPILTMATMFVSGLLTPATSDNTQTKMIRYIMPLMFGGFMIVLPSALAVYYFMSTLLGIGQQWFVRKKYGSIKPAQGPDALKKPTEIKSAKDLVLSIKDGEAQRINAAATWLEAITTGAEDAGAGKRSTMLNTRETYVKAVRPLLSKSNPDVQAAAARILGVTRDEKSVSRIAELLKGNGAQRKAAIEALGKIASPKARAPLRASMQLIRFWEYPSIIAALTAIDTRERAATSQGKK